MSEATSTIGTDLKLGDGAQPATYASVEGVTSINGFGTTRSEVDTTTLKSSSKMFKLGLKDNGTLQVETNYDPTDDQHQSIRDLNESGAKRSWQLVLMDDDGAPAETFQFDGYVSGWSLRVDIDNVYKATLSIRITGDVVSVP